MLLYWRPALAVPNGRAQGAEGLAAEQLAALGGAAGVDVQAAFEHEVGEVAGAEVFGALEADAAAATGRRR